ncbi:uncharacterized protein TNCV_2220511 [Trichonephila clavipes]|nr:uncharacterized protein TNCV_2220511 [Trichonephila clavipes]
MCCAKGKVKLPELHSPPEPLSMFLSGVRRVSKHFLENIRKYNACFQMTSFGATNIVREKLHADIQSPRANLSSCRIASTIAGRKSQKVPSHLFYGKQ